MKKVLCVMLLMLLMTMSLYGCSSFDRFYCDHCHQWKQEKPVNILVEPQMVDMTICHDCYEKYLKGEPML